MTASRPIGIVKGKAIRPKAQQIEWVGISVKPMHKPMRKYEETM